MRTLDTIVIHALLVGKWILLLMKGKVRISSLGEIHTDNLVLPGGDGQALYSRNFCG